MPSPCPRRKANRTTTPLDMSKFGTVIIGKTLIWNEFDRFHVRFDSRQGKHSIHAILAHEFAHILQFQQRFALPWKFPELHADFLSGWEFGHLKRGEGQPEPPSSRPPDAAPFIGEAMPEKYDEVIGLVAFYRRGDSAFYSPDHHGSKKERADAFFSGFECPAREVGEAYRLGLNYVNGLKP